MDGNGPTDEGRRFGCYRARSIVADRRFADPPDADVLGRRAIGKTTGVGGKVRKTGKVQAAH